MALAWLRYLGWPAADNLWRHEGAYLATLDVSYDDDATAVRRADIFVPARGDGPWPTVLFAHGGAWRAQHRRFVRWLTGLYSNVGAALATHDIATVVAGYQQPPDGDGEDGLRDLAAACAWIRDAGDTHGLDPARLVIAGHSAGGHLAFALASDRDLLPEPPRAAISMAGFYDVARMAAGVGKHGPALRALFGDSDEALARRSPERSLPMPVPCLAMVGERDPAPLRAEFEALKRAAAACGDDQLRLQTIAGATHMGLVGQIGRATDRVTPLCVEFVRATCA